MKNIIFGLTLAVGFLGTACSNQYHESGVEASEEDVFAIYDELNTNSTDAATFTDLRSDTSSTVYFAQSGEAFGSPLSLFSFGDTSFLGQGISGRADEINMSAVSIVFLDAIDSNNSRRFGIMIKIETTNGASTYFSKVSDAQDGYSFSSGSFAARFTLDDGSSLVLRSNDVDSTYKDELAPAIHLKAYIDRGGGESAIGQISILKGYGGI